jgi:hypothetical protein
MVARNETMPFIDASGSRGTMPLFKRDSINGVRRQNPINNLSIKVLSVNLILSNTSIYSNPLQGLKLPAIYTSIAWKNSGI